jgi:hypothetical protein
MSLFCLDGCSFGVEVNAVGLEYSGFDGQHMLSIDDVCADVFSSISVSHGLIYRPDSRGSTPYVSQLECIPGVRHGQKAINNSFRGPLNDTAPSPGQDGKHRIPLLAKRARDIEPIVGMWGTIFFGFFKLDSSSVGSTAW